MKAVTIKLRRLLTAFAYLLMEGLRRGALRSTCLAGATVGSIRLKLLKIGSQVTTSIRSSLFANSGEN